MAKNTGIIQFTGKLGQLVGGQKAKGIGTIRAYNGTVKNPNAEGQLKQRAKFKLASVLGKTFRGHLDGLAQKARSEKITEQNYFVKMLMKDSISVSGTKAQDNIQAGLDTDSLSLTYSDVTMNVPIGTLSFATPLTVSLPITPSAENEGKVVHMVVYDPEAGEVLEEVKLLTPTDNEIALSVPDYWNGHRVTVYVWAQTFDSVDAAYNYVMSGTSSRWQCDAERTTMALAGTPTATLLAGHGTIE